METHETSATLPPVKVRISLGSEDLTIKVGKDNVVMEKKRQVRVNDSILHWQMSDRGGGVPLRKIERLFSYMYSTAPSPVHTDNSRNAPLVRAALHSNKQKKTSLICHIWFPTVAECASVS